MTRRVLPLMVLLLMTIVGGLHAPAAENRVLAASTPGLTTWTPQGSGTPLARAAATMASDPANAGAVLFGGANYSAYVPLDDTWTWDSLTETWHLRTPLSHPPGRSAAAMGYDGRQVILFGGASAGLSFRAGLPVYGQAVRLSDMWAWNGTEWHQITHPPGVRWPAARVSASMAFDEAAGHLLMFGGDATPFEDPPTTWVWNGSAWSDRTDPHPTADNTPHLVSQGAMAYDGRDVVLSGIDHVGKSETWTWDGAGWHRRHPSIEPAPLLGATMAYDATQHVAVRFGGAPDGGGPASGDTWSWDGNAWARLAPVVSPPARAYHAMAYDGTRIVLQGGVPNSATWYGELRTQSDTWTYDVVPPTAANGPTATQLTSSLNPSHVGDQVVLTAAVNSVAAPVPGHGPGGTVTFRDGQSTLGSSPLSAGLARWSTAALAEGTHVLTAFYGGDATSLPNLSAPLVQQVLAVPGRSPGPLITSMSPSCGSPLGTTTVNMAGQNFTPRTRIFFGQVATSPPNVNASGTSLTVAAPAQPVGTVTVAFAPGSGGPSFVYADVCGPGSGDLGKQASSGDGALETVHSSAFTPASPAGVPSADVSKASARGDTSKAGVANPLASYSHAAPPGGPTGVPSALAPGSAPVTPPVLQPAMLAQSGGLISQSGAMLNLGLAPSHPQDEREVALEHLHSMVRRSDATPALAAVAAGGACMVVVTGLLIGTRRRAPRPRPAVARAW